MSVIVVRPYSKRIRARVFSLLTEAGLDMEGAHVIPPGTSDDHVLDELRKLHAQVLLVPFHAHRDWDGNVVNGLELLRRLDDECPSHRETLIFMPISAMGMSSLTLMLSRDGEAGGLPARVRERVLFMPEANLDGRQIAAEVKRHAQRSGRRPGSRVPFPVA